MEQKTIYTIGTILLFLGLFTIMIPEITPHVHDGTETKEHEHKEPLVFKSTIYGFIITITGLFCMEKSQKTLAKTSAKR